MSSLNTYHYLNFFFFIVSNFQLSWGEGVAEGEDVGVVEEEEGDVASSII